MANDQKVLRCTQCRQQFSEEDVLAYNYFVQNGLCYQCCEAMRKAPVKQSCFGKKRKYDSDALECRDLCPDRKVCPMFVNGSIIEYRDLTVEARQQALKFLKRTVKRKRPPRPYPFRFGTTLHGGFEMCRRGCSRRELEKYCEKRKASIGWLLRILRREECNGHEWKWADSEGTYRITEWSRPAGAQEVQ